MNRHQQINHRQMAWLIGGVLTTAALITMPRTLADLAGVDAWFSQIVPVFYALGIAYLFVSLAGTFPGKHIFEISFHLAGKWAGGAINLILLVNLWFIMVRDTRALTTFLKTTILPRTPEEITLLFFMIAILYYGRTSLEVAARVNDFVFPLFWGTVLALPLILANEFSIRSLQPMFTGEVWSVAYANMLSIGGYGDLLVAGAFLHTITVTKQLQASIRHGVALAAFALTVILVVDTAVLGANIANKTIYPSYTLIQQINITDFLDRMDIVLFSLWLPSFFLKSAFAFLALLTGIGSFVGTRDCRIYNKPLAWFVLITTILAFHNVSELIMFANYSSAVIVLAIQPLLLLLLFALSRAKRKIASSNGRRAADADDGQGADAGDAEQTAQDRAKNERTERSHRAWLKTGNMLLAACFGLVVAGFWLGQDYPTIANLVGIGYLLCLLLSVVATFIELLKSSRLRSPHPPSSK